MQTMNKLTDVGWLAGGFISESLTAYLRL